MYSGSKKRFEHFKNLGVTKIECIVFLYTDCDMNALFDGLDAPISVKEFADVINGLKCWNDNFNNGYFKHKFNDLSQL